MASKARKAISPKTARKGAVKPNLSKGTGPKTAAALKSHGGSGRAAMVRDTDNDGY